MKAQLVKENIEFKRGQDTKDALGLGYRSAEQLQKKFNGVFKRYNNYFKKSSLGDPDFLSTLNWTLVNTKNYLGDEIDASEWFAPYYIGYDPIPDKKNIKENLDLVIKSYDVSKRKASQAAFQFLDACDKALQKIGY